MADGIGRSKDGVPQWSGEAASFQDYEDQCLQWEQSIAYNKRYLAAPRLIGELIPRWREPLDAAPEEESGQTPNPRTFRTPQPLLQEQPEEEV